MWKKIMKNNSKQSIGIIGGMGPQASAKLLEVLIAMCAKDFGAKNDEDFPEIILNSVPVPNFVSNEDNLEEVLNILKERVRNLEKFRPSCLAIACNTAHILLEELQANTDIPFVSIIDEVTKRVVDSGINKVGLLGTPITIRSGLYQKKLSEKQIKVIKPTGKELSAIEKVIRNVLAGKLNNSDEGRLIAIADSLRRKGAEGIILGCTELPLIFPKDFSVPVFDSIEILAQALLQKFYETNNKNGIIKI